MYIYVYLCIYMYIYVYICIYVCMVGSLVPCSTYLIQILFLVLFFEILCLSSDLLRL